MHPFFHHTIDSRLTATPAYFELLQGQFQGDQSSGILHAHISPDQQLVVLFVNGVRSLVYLLDPAGRRPLAPEAAAALWTSSEAAVRSLVAPSPAVRAVWQVLEWGAAACQTLEARGFDSYLDECRRQKCSGLLYLDTPTSDGFLTLWNGELHNAETIFDSARGFADAPSLSRRALEAPREAWQVEYYPCRPESASGQQFVLRQALAAWINLALTHYQNMVGQNLVNNANYALNTLSRKRFLDIRTVGTTLIDRQFFPDRAQMTLAYRQLLPALLDQMEQVIGVGLVRRAVDGALNDLHPQLKQALEEAGLGVQSDLWKR